MKPITIVGGGLAGLTLGIGLRQRGLPATVYEAGNYPRHRVCGEFISGRGQIALQELGLLKKLDRHALIARDAAFFAEQKSIHHQLPEPALSISRYDLDAFLAQTFQQLGGELKVNERWTGQFTDGVIRATGRRAQTSAASG